MPKPDTESKAATASTVDLLQYDLCLHEQRLVNLISSSNDARISSDPDVLMLLSEALEM